MKVFHAVCGSWRAVFRTASLLVVVGVGLWLLPVDFEFGPVKVDHLEPCGVPDPVYVPQPGPVPGAGGTTSPPPPVA
jgi:hypothetical protein